MRLPNPEHAYIDPGKLSGYCLNPAHEEGGHKARVFAAALGLTARNATELQDALQAAVLEHPSVPLTANAQGERFRLDFLMTRDMRSAIVRSIWIVRHEEDFPRLVTCYVRRKGIE